MVQYHRWLAGDDSSTADCEHCQSGFAAAVSGAVALGVVIDAEILANNGMVLP